MGKEDLPLCAQTRCRQGHADRPERRAVKVQQRRGNAADAQLMLLAVGGPAVLPGLDQLGDQIRVIDNGVRRVMTVRCQIAVTSASGRQDKMLLPTAVQYIGLRSPTNDAMRTVLSPIFSL